MMESKFIIPSLDSTLQFDAHLDLPHLHCEMKSDPDVLRSLRNLFASDYGAVLTYLGTWNTVW
jgi:hypothetical protein